MQRRLFMWLMLALVPLLWASAAAAQAPRDKAANKKIDEAINEQYLTTNFDKAEGILIGTINACDDKCSPAVLARAWMYLGIVRGSGKNDLPGAQEAFAQAVALDPAIKLDGELATAKTGRAFEAAGGRGTRAEAPRVDGEPEPGAALKCTPAPAELPTRYPLPVSCAAEDGTKLQLYFAAPGGGWKKLTMKNRGGMFQAQVPCSATQNPGSLRIYVRARRENGRSAGQWGSRDAPVEFSLAADSSAAPASYPNQDAPARCAEAEECPPDFPGCGESSKAPDSSGATCDASSDCESGEECVSGACEASAPAAAGSFKRNYVGIHFAQEWAFVGGDDVCSSDSQASNAFACFLKDTETPFPGKAQPGRANNIESGLVLATRRFLVSYDRAFTPQFMLGVRAGYALSGGPPSRTGTKFLPVHFEVRGTFFPLKDSLTVRRFRPYVHLGGGMAQVDAKMQVRVVDCDQTLAGTASPEQSTLCAAGNPSVQHLQRDLDAYKKLGQGFVAFGGGALLTLNQLLAVQLNLNGMFMLPDSGAVLQPSLGLVAGF